MADMNDRAKTCSDPAAEKARMMAEQAGNAAMQSGQQMRDQACMMAGEACEKAENWVGTARDAMQNATHKAERWAGDAYEVTSEKLSDFGNEMTRLVRNHPLPAVLIGFGLGLLIGRSARML